MHAGTYGHGRMHARTDNKKKCFCRIGEGIKRKRSFDFVFIIEAVLSKKNRWQKMQQQLSVLQSFEESPNEQVPDSSSKTSFINYYYYQFSYSTNNCIFCNFILYAVTYNIG